MSRTVIVYASMHHGNTLKLAQAIADQYPVDLLDAVKAGETDLSGYDCIGIAAGVAYGKYYPRMLEFLKKNLPQGKNVFFLHTAGDPREKHNAAAKQIAEARGCTTLGTFCCKGFDTYGPFKLVGGINKNRPNSDDVAAAVKFFGEIQSENT